MLNSAPQKFISTCNMWMWPYLEKGFRRCNLIKIKSCLIVVDLIQWLVFCKEEANSDTEKQKRRRKSHNDGGRDGRDASTSQGTLGIVGNCQKLGEKHQQVHPLCLQKGINPVDAWIQTHNFWNKQTKTIPFLLHLVWSALLGQLFQTEALADDLKWDEDFFDLGLLTRIPNSMFLFKLQFPVSVF